jgi:transposase
MPVNITEEFVRDLFGQIADLTAQVAALSEQNAELTAQIDKLLQTIKELEEKKNKNSQNSSKPPSSDGYKKPEPKSQRKKSGKKQGGQKGHEGTNLPQMAADYVVNCMPSKCKRCSHHNECMKKAELVERRQVVDAKVQTTVTEYNKYRFCNCPLHGWSARDGAFPSGVNAAVQYGNNLQSLVIALNTVGAVSVSRTQEILSNVFNIPLSTGTIASMVSRCSDRLNGVIAEIETRLLASCVNNADETGMRVDKKLQWVHVFCNASYTVLKVNSRRGWQAMEEIGLIPNYHGIIIHDCWSPYWKHPDEITHSICCAHLLRELTGVEENNPSYTWPKAFKDLLLEMKKKRDQEAENGGSELDPVEIERFSQRYDSIIKTAYEETPPPKVDPNKKKGRKKRGKVLALVDRLTAYKESVCLFVKNFAVQFDNNQAERDLRMTKAKSKISGCFRTIEGAQDYLNIMSYVSTAKKQGYNAYEAIKNAVSDDPFFIFQ